MFFIYEPITMYGANINDFWFDLYIMLKPSTLMFLAHFSIIFSLYIIIYLINKQFSEKLYVYKAFVITWKLLITI